VVQMGLTKSEIAQLDRRRMQLLRQVDERRVGLIEEQRP
jgi:hypothetical protein